MWIWLMIWLLIMDMNSGYLCWWLQSFNKAHKYEPDLYSCLGPRFPLGHYAKPFGILVIFDISLCCGSSARVSWKCFILVLFVNVYGFTGSPVLLATDFLVVWTYFELWRLVHLYSSAQRVISSTVPWNRFPVWFVRLPAVLSCCWLCSLILFYC